MNVAPASTTAPDTAPETDSPEKTARRRPVHVAFLPSVSGGLGHVTRTVNLARGLERADPSLRISFLLDEYRLRPINLAAVRRTGYPVRLLPDPDRHERGEKVGEVLGDVDVVIEDTNRRSIVHRRVAPSIKAWISIPMLPIRDELFLEWPLLEYVDHILYAYPTAMPLPEELEPYRTKLTITGPILDTSRPADRAAGRRHLGIPDDARYLLYSPRGFPFGRPFGQKVLRGLIGAFRALHADLPDLHLVLSAVTEPAEVRLRRVPPPADVPGVVLQGLVAPEVYWDCLVGADLVVVEGTSTLFDAALARTPVLMVPGTIYETRLEGELVAQHDAGVVLQVDEATPRRMTKAIRDALAPARAVARADRLHALVGTGGRDVAVDAILRVIRERVGPRR